MNDETVKLSRSLCILPFLQMRKYAAVSREKNINKHLPQFPVFLLTRYAFWLIFSIYSCRKTETWDGFMNYDSYIWALLIDQTV